MVITLFKWLSAAAVVLLHPFYVSVTELQHNEKEKLLEITCKIYSDDFEKTLSQQNASLIRLKSPKDVQLLNKQINEYVQQHLKIRINDKVVPFVFVGYEVEDDAVLIYFQCEQITAVKNIEIFNSLLHDFNKTQANIVHVLVKGIRKSTKLDYPKTSTSFEF